MYNDDADDDDDGMEIGGFEKLLFLSSPLGN